MNMNFNEKSIKKISGLLIISVLSLNLAFFSFTQKAEAIPTETILVTDPTTLSFFSASFTHFGITEAKAAAQVSDQLTQNIWTKVQAAAIKIAEGLLRNLALRVIQQITEKTVDWIQSGFKGNPAYIDDPKTFFRNTADATVGDMIFNDPDLNFLCSPFQIQIKLALGFSFQTFRSRINCTLSGVANNVQNAVRGASATLNVWDNWIQTTTNAQNTPIGAYLIAQGELNARIGDKQIDLQGQLNRGFGALNYEECTGTKTPRNIAGPGLGEPYTYKGSKFYEEQSRDNNNFVYSGIKCVVKTPGNVISSMLGFKATSDQRRTELVAALGDGIDTVFAALANALLKKALAQLTDGVLGTNNTSENATWNYNLSTLASESQANYNNDITNLNAAGVTAPEDIFAQFNRIFSPSSTSSLSNSAITATTPSGSTTSFSAGFNQYSFTPTSVTTGGGSIDSIKANALSGINYYLNSEATYQNTLTFASSTLSAARIIFVTARNCNVSYNTWPSILRSDLINSNVIKNIDGIVYTDSFRTLAQIPWNLTAINNWINTSNSNISILNTAQSAVSAATTPTQITDAMTPVNSTSFNTDPQKDMVTNIKTWLRGVRDIYSTTQCPINLDKVLAATSTPALGY